MTIESPTSTDQPARRSPRATLLTRISLAIIAVAALAVLAVAISVEGQPAIAWLASKIGTSQFGQRIFNEIFTSGSFYASVALILVLEKVIPIQRSQRLLSVSFFQDFIYYILDVFSGMFILFYWMLLLKWVYDHTLWFLTVDVIRNWPAWAQGVAGFVGLDFLRWLHHYIRHKVPWFWHFHTIHHCQRNMNLFTDHRYHVVEYLIANAVTFIPLFALGLKGPTVFKIAILLRCFTRFYHANIKTNLGPLRYILVTPQSHRIHHSTQPEHRDKNFGVFFSIWDQLFGTQYRGWDEYPETGVDDETLPLEHSWLDILIIPVKQFIYPFRLIYESLRAK